MCVPGVCVHGNGYVSLKQTGLHSRGVARARPGGPLPHRRHQGGVSREQGARLAVDHGQRAAARVVDHVDVVNTRENK